MLYEGPEFDISFRSAQVLAFIFVTLTYCGGIPLLLPILAFYFFLRYWTDKYQILRHYKKPPRYDMNIHDKMMLILPLAVLMHIAFSWWMYTQQDIFPVDIQINQNGEAQSITPTFSQRFYSENGLPFTILFIIVFLFFTVQQIAVHLVFFWKQHNKGLSKVEKLAPKFSQVKEKLETYGNNTYEPSEHPEY